MNAFRLSSDTAPPVARVDVMQELLASVVNSHVDIPRVGPWFIESVLQPLPGLTIARNASIGCTVARSKQHIAKDGNDDVMVCIVTEGEMEVSSESGEAVFLRTGDVYLQSNDVPTRRRFREKRTSFIDVGIPRRLLEDALSGARRLPIQSKIGTTAAPELKLLGGYAGMIIDHAGMAPEAVGTTPGAAGMAPEAVDTAPGAAGMAPEAVDTAPGAAGMAPEAAGMAPEVRQGTTLPAHVAAVAATHLHDLIVTALDAGRQPSELALGRGVRAAKLATVKAEIRARAACSDLSIDGVAKRCGISPQYVRKLFRAEGTTFTDFVRNERLKRAWRRLTDPRCSRWSITAVALECGFADLSYFNRLFRRRYGMTPSDAKVLGHALSGSTGSAANLPRLSAFCPTSRRVLSKII